MSVDKTPTGVVYTVTNGTAGQQYPLTFPYIKGADVKAYYVANGTPTKEPTCLLIKRPLA